MNVTVIIPTFNRIDTISRALDSVFAQTDPAQEVIVVDDGSTDGTADYVRQHYPEVRLLSQTNLGVSAARNQGISHSTHEWIALLDSDDEWLPDKLNRQRRCLAESNYLFCHTDEIWIRNGRRVNPKHKHRKPEGWVFSASLPLCCVSPSSALIHRSVLESIGVFDESLPACEDYDLWLRIFSRLPVCLVNAPLVVKYGGHSDQLSQRYWGMDRFRVKAISKVLDEGHLSESDRAEALSMLQLKLDVLINGFRKRQKTTEVAQYEAIQACYLAAPTVDTV